MPRASKATFRAPKVPIFLLCLNVIYLVSLVVAALIYIKFQGWKWDWDRRGALPIAWFGMLGATAASLNGVTKHARKWNHDWNLWYIVRPLLGGVFGAVGYLIYIAIVQASLTSPNASGSQRPTILALVIAFALGYREEMFRELIRRVVDLVATGGSADIEAPSAPTDLRMCDESYTQGKAKFSWLTATDNVGVVGYNIYRDGHLLAAVRCNPARSTGDNQEPDRIYFEDRTAASNRDSPEPAYYAVTAADRAGNESEPVGPVCVVLSTTVKGGTPDRQGDPERDSR
jgi:hypothetical protein